MEHAFEHGLFRNYWWLKISGIITLVSILCSVIAFGAGLIPLSITSLCTPFVYLFGLYLYLNFSAGSKDGTTLKQNIRCTAFFTAVIICLTGLPLFF